MLRKPTFLMIVVLVLASLACGMPRPPEKVKTGPTQTMSIDIPVPGDASVMDLELQFGVGELTIDPGAEAFMVQGSAKYNIEQLAPEINTDGASVSIRQGNMDEGRIFNFGNDIENEWVLRLSATPLRLRINAGAYQGHYELGGLAIQKLVVQDGAADVKLSFDRPNLVEMSLLSYTTGASSVKLSGLANANFTEMAFKGGAGDYTLDFSGEFQRDADVTVDAGISNVTILVPDGMNVKLTFDGGLSNVDVDGNWQQNGTRYTQVGAGPTLTIRVKMGAGNLSLDNP